MEPRDIPNPIAEADFRAQSAHETIESAQHSQQHVKNETIRPTCANRSWNCIDFIKNCDGCDFYEKA